MDQEIEKLLNTSFKISLDEAAYLILSFLREPTLYELAINEAIGGTVSRDAIKNEHGAVYNGSMGWYCRNDDGIKEFPKLFMAFEDGSYDVAKVPKLPTSTKLKYPGHTFTYNGKVNEEEVINMLKTDCFPLVDDLEIDKDDLLNFINKFPNDSHIKPYNKYPCSFFENRGKVTLDMRDFLEPSNLKAVRYYFGYDSSYSHAKSNRIRVIFVGVDSDGNNIIGSDERMTVTSRLVQNSWPPPPPPNSI